MYRHVLVAIELRSEPARRVLARAREFLAPGGQLSAVHVVEPQQVQYSVDPTFTGTLTETIAQEAVDTAAARLAELCEPLAIDAAHCHVRLGRVADQVHALATEQGCDVIVIGSHGQDGMRLLLGSTANSVLHDAPVDVATVRLGADPT